MDRTIAALATPPGVSGIAVIRISGIEAFRIVNQCFKSKNSILDSKSHTIHYGKFYNKGALIDTVTVSLFKAPNSYTGEDVIEIGCHGGFAVYEEILAVLYQAGASQAEAGEFTKRAFLNGKLDLIQAEAVADIIHSASHTGSQTAVRQLVGLFTTRLKELRLKLLDISALLELELDFAEEDLEFVDKSKIQVQIELTTDFCKNLLNSYYDAQVLRSGFFVAIVGYPNAGKSTLFNSLIQRQRAITSHIPGTTRDYIEEYINLAGIPIKFIDTAGLRATDDTIEIQGIQLVETIMQQANMLLVLNDISISPKNSNDLYRELKEKYPDTEIVLVHNKVDLTNNKIGTNNVNTFYIIAKSQKGISELREHIKRKAEISAQRVSDILLNERHKNLLLEALVNLSDAKNSLETGMENELIAVDIKKAVSILGEMTGESYNEEVINHIFGQFCIGK